MNAIILERSFDIFRTVKGYTVFGQHKIHRLEVTPFFTRKKGLIQLPH